MLSSNKPIGGSVARSSFSSANLARNTQTIDNMKVRNQMRRTNNAMVGGKSESLAKAVAASGMGRPIQPVQRNPVVRKRTAKEFAE